MSDSEDDDSDYAPENGKSVIIIILSNIILKCFTWLHPFSTEKEDDEGEDEKVWYRYNTVVFKIHLSSVWCLQRLTSR